MYAILSVLFLKKRRRERLLEERVMEEMSRRRLAIVVAGAAAVLLCCAVPVQAALITLSTHSSDGFLPYTEPEYLDATLDFSVVGNELTLIVTNTTDGNPTGCEFAITEVYFNYDNTVTGLSWDGTATNGWALHDNPDNFHVDGFGYFDVRLYLDPPPNKDIDPGNSETFSFSFIFDGTGSAEDFTTYMSADKGSGDTLGLAAAQFVGGGNPGDAWAYGMTTVPEPATIALLGLGALVLLRKRKSA